MSWGTDMNEVYSCPNCNSRIEYLQEICTGCGAGVDWGGVGYTVADEDLVICQGCHKEIPKTSRFCPDCGAQQLRNGFADYENDRILPKCPKCSAELDYGANRCDECGAEIEWESTKDLLVDLNSLAVKETIPRANRERVEEDYGSPTVEFDTFRFKLKGSGVLTEPGKYYSPPVIYYDSFGVYNE